MSVNDHRTAPTTELFTVQTGATDQSATFIFGNEDHTLGNALRHLLIQRNETDFCGYSVPHPYEPKMHVRLQTKNIRAIDGLKQGLSDLEDVSNLLEDRFMEALERFQQGEITASHSKSSQSGAMDTSAGAEDLVGSSGKKKAASKKR
jgi:DNA-directed RNA polymerase I and III subunit RPAC2